jgi:hypothetical protein
VLVVPVASPPSVLIGAAVEVAVVVEVEVGVAEDQQAGKAGQPLADQLGVQAPRGFESLALRSGGDGPRLGGGRGGAAAGVPDAGVTARAAEEHVDAVLVVHDAQDLAGEDQLPAGAIGTEDVEHGFSSGLLGAGGVPATDKSTVR